MFNWYIAPLLSFIFLKLLHLLELNEFQVLSWENYFYNYNLGKLFENNKPKSSSTSVSSNSSKPSTDSKSGPSKLNGFQNKKWTLFLLKTGSFLYFLVIKKNIFAINLVILNQLLIILINFFHLKLLWFFNLK
jgi:hypothetical protein